MGELFMDHMISSPNEVSRNICSGSIIKLVIRFVIFLEYHLEISDCAIETRFLSARRYANAVFATVTCPSVRLSVRTSVTRRYCA